MSNSPNFGSILDKPSTDVEKPKPLPAGSYICVVKGLPKQDKSSKKGTEYVEFTLTPLQAGEDVDEEALTNWASKADGSTRSLSDTSLRCTFYLTEDSIYRLKGFLVDDLEIEEEDKSLRQMIDETPGRQVLAHVKHTASEDGTTVYANVAKTAPVE